jgi:hypothetical protein
MLESVNDLNMVVQPFKELLQSHMERLSYLSGRLQGRVPLTRKYQRDMRQRYPGGEGYHAEANVGVAKEDSLGRRPMLQTSMWSRGILYIISECSSILHDS